MNKEFQTLRKKQRFGLRKLNIGVASVLLGFTIFGYNLVSQAPVAHAASQAPVATSAGSGSSGSSATGVASGSQASNSQTTSATSSAATASQTTPATQVTVPAASQSSAPANSDNASSSTANQAGTVSANHTAIGTTPSSQTVSVNETTSSATQARTLMMNLAVVNPNKENTTLPKSTQKYTLVTQPLLTDYLNHLRDGKRDGNTWVDKNLYWFRDKTLNTIFGTTSKSKPGIIASHPDKYFFGAYVDYNSSYHRVILLARSQNPTDHNLYSYTIHTGISQNTSTTIAAPNTDTQEVYGGASGSKYDLIFKNYQGKSYVVILKGFEHRDGEYGLLPVFDGGLLDPTYGSNTYDQNNKAAETKSIGFWAGAIPQETSTKVRYVDQATGKDIVQPMEISGFGYQGFQVKGEAPTVKGYHVVSKPKSLGLAYEDGTIAPYKVGQTYDLALPDSVVIKQTVIDTDGTVRATAYYKGSPVSKNASRILGHESDNDQMSFVTPDSKFHTYTNRISQVDDSYIYYYAKDSDPNGSEMRLHFIDVTGVNNSYYAPSDGPELDADKVKTIHGNIGENYSFTYTVPKGYDQVGTSDVTGTYSVTHHDAYVYVKIDRKGAKAAIDQALNKKTSEINGANNLDQTTKDKLLQDATDAADAAKNAIGQATTADAIKKAQGDGVSNINNVKVPTSLEAAKQAANQVVEDAVTQQKALINKANNLSDNEKQALNNQVDAAAKTAQDAITAATTNDVATKAGQDGKTAIEQVVPTSLEAAKKAAKDAVDKDAAKQKELINNSNNLSASEKQALTNKVDSATQTAKDAIDGATTNDGATNAGQDGKTAIEKVVPTDSDVKKNAKDAIDKALNNKKSEITGATNLDQPTKDNLIQAATDAANKAKDAINQATTNNDVATEQTKGTNAIDAVKVPSLTDSQSAAKKAIDDALNTKTSEINGATNIDQPTKTS